MSTKQSLTSKIMWLLGPIFLSVFVQTIFATFGLSSDTWLAIAGALGAVVAALPMWKNTRKYYVDKFDASCRLWFVTLVAAVLFFAINAIMGCLFAMIDVYEIFPSYKNVGSISSNVSIPIFIIFVGIFAPIGEELLLRGVVLNRALKWMHSWVAIIATSGIFGLLHMNLLQSIYAFLLGVLLGWLYVKFRSVLVPIVGHIMFNVSDLIINSIVGDKNSVDETGISSFSDISFILIPAVIIAFTCIVTLNILPKAKFIEASKYDSPKVDLP